MNTSEVVFLAIGSVTYFSALAAVCLVWMRWCRRFDHPAVFIALGVGVPWLALFPTWVMFLAVIR